MTENIVYNPIKNKSLEKNRCFLCGAKLNKSNRTTEHIFPKWLLSRFDLWNKKLVLLNRTSIRYKNIRIPCCKKCNNEGLSRLESGIEAITKRGYSCFCKVPRKKIFLWLSKIFYEILYMEMRLLFDLSDKSQGTIMNKRSLEQFRACHQFLQAVRIKCKFHKPVPWSIFVFKVQKYAEKERNFDFRDNIFSLTVALRMNDMGIIACLQDNHAHEDIFGSYFNKIHRIALHPAQFNELVAMIFYKTSLLNRIPKYVTVLLEDRIEVFSLPLQGYSSKPIFDDWSQQEFAKFVSFHCGIPYEQAFHPPDKVWSILFDERQRLKKFNIKSCGF